MAAKGERQVTHNKGPPTVQTLHAAVNATKGKQK